MKANDFLDDDHFFMEEALNEAKKAFEKGEVPVGTVLVYQEKIITRGHNLIENSKDPTMHAELICIRAASKIFKDWRLLETTLYSTLEPCSMCMGALLLARIKRLIWAAPDLRHGANGSWVDLLEKKHPTHQIECRGGLLEKEAAELMRQFFQKQRLKK